MNLNLDFIRSQFPGLDTDWTLFDNAGGSQIAWPVVRRMIEYCQTSFVQLGGSYHPSRLADERLADAVAWMAQYVNAADPSEIVLGTSTSMNMRVLSLGLAETFRPGDEVIHTNLDHEANIGPWADLAKRGITVKTWRVNPDSWQLEVDDLQSLLNDRTRLVAVTHASNVVATINPIREIARVVHDAGAMICVDGVAYAPHARVDVRALGVDFYGFSLYKTYGPHYALLYGRRELLERIPGLNHYFLANEVPYRFQPGNVNHELTYSLTGLRDYWREFARAHGRADLEHDPAALLSWAFDAVAAHEQALATPLIELLKSKRNVRIIGLPTADRSQRMPTIAFVVDGRTSDEIPTAVDEHRIGIRWGDFYAARLIDALGLREKNGVIRASFVHYNTLDEVDRLVEVLDKLL
ncbi:MAG TPA: aminotransferase class V-fold PLP-dependent enzyme [Candidatus Krumholzibacteria bacterium]